MEMLLVIAFRTDAKTWQHALEAPEDEEWVPPEYEGTHMDLVDGFHKHEADFLNLIGMSKCQL